MLIVRNVYFSAYDENGEERLYSTTELISEEDYMEKLYAEAAAAEEDENGEERLYSIKDLSHKVAKKFRKLTGRETIKDKAENVVESAKKGVKTAGKWAAKEAGKGKDLAMKGVKLAKANPVKTAIGATTAVAVPVASVAGYEYYKKHKKACK